MTTGLGRRDLAKGSDELETVRLEALARYDVLDSPREEAFDEIAALAATICEAPIAVVNFIGDGRQFFKAEVGLGVRETPLESSFCAKALLEQEFLIVPDATKDPRFDCNPLVTGEPYIRFYAGALLRTAEGLPIGTVCVLDYKARPLFENQRQTLRLLARQVMTQLDLTWTVRQRDRDLARAQASEERLRLVLDSARDYAILTVDVDRRITSWSTGAAETFLRSAAEAIGRSIDDLFTPEDRAAGVPEAEIAEAAASGCAPDVRWHVRADGSRVFMNGSMHRLPDDEAGRARGFLKIARNETARRESEERLREGEDLLRLATEAAEVGFWDVDIDRDELFWPPLVKAMFGISPDVPVSMADFYAGLHPDDLEATSAAFALAADPAIRAMYDVEYRTIGKEDGVLRWVAAKGRGVFDEAGHCARAIGAAIDITERKKIEERLRELNETLEQRVAEEVERRGEAEERLRQAQKMEAVGQLTGGIAHDFNNMLTGVIGSLDLVQRHIAAGRLERVDRYIDAATTSAQRAAALTARLLAFGRRQSLDLQPVDANALVAGMEDLLHRTLGEQVSLETHLPADLWSAKTDVSQLENALLNLCINARDAMPDGGKLTIETANARLDERYARDHAEVEPGDYVAVCVSDTGTGMSPATIEKVFEPFFTTKPVGQGTGLGLSMIYGFAKQSGGHVRIYSELGQGTTIRLYLPRCPVEAEPPERAQRVAPLGKGEAVMIVEDDDSVRMIVLEVLEELGYEAIEAVDAHTAIPILESGRRIDLLVSDVGLPGLNGRQLAEIARKARPDLRILFITGYAQEAAVRGGFLGEGMEMMTKPFAIDALATRIRVMLGK